MTKYDYCVCRCKFDAYENISLKKVQFFSRDFYTVYPARTKSAVVNPAFVKSVTDKPAFV